MPPSWASGGSRLELPIAVEFRPGGVLAVVGAGAFLGEWLEPPDSMQTILQFFSALQEAFPRTDGELARPNVTGGKWRLIEDGRVVQFFVRVSGFQRGKIWLPEGRLRFRAKAYGQVLAQGTDAAVTIRESRAAFGAFFGAFAGITLGPVAFALSGLAAAWALRRVAVVVGRWAPTRLEAVDEPTVSLEPVRLTMDDPDRWQ